MTECQVSHFLSNGLENDSSGWMESKEATVLKCQESEHFGEEDMGVLYCSGNFSVRLKKIKGVSTCEHACIFF